MQIYRCVKKNQISQYFGQNKISLYRDMGLKGHTGLDFVEKRGKPIYWDVDTRGKVYKIETDSAGGLGIDLISKDTNGQEYKHRYWHLSSYADINVDDIVETGDIIGYVGSTGLSTGPHAHRGLKPVRWDSDKHKYINIYQSNGFYGNINPIPFFTNIFVVDYMDNLKGQLSVLRKVVYLYQLLINKII